MDMISILYVDDEPALCDLFAQLLEADGRTIDCFSEVNAAIEKARQQAYEYVFVDYRMPVMNGSDLIKTLHPILAPDTKYFLLSGDLNQEGLVALDLPVAVTCITKPFSYEDIDALLK